MSELPAPLAPAEPVSLHHACTCLRDGKPCGVCRLRDRHIGWLEARPEPQETGAPDA